MFNLDKNGKLIFIVNLIIITLIMVLACKSIGDNNNNISESPKGLSSENISNSESITVTSSPMTSISELKSEQSKLEVSEIPEQQYPVFQYSKDWDSEDEYLLAKIAMAEAEGCNIQTKSLIILVVLNRVNDKSNAFPDSIQEVIFQKVGNVYQFSPCMPNGRWYEVEPDESCYEAVELVKQSEYDYSDGALYFENCEDENNWHSRNLTFLYESQGIRFYK